ncbi:hypothetical protein NA56DRAFT_708111 [Hyaloscypha hepaticicola]|uniref:Uncharacterized protein n=1 Tax=Hyaloscypha hepaticicola TaxID=2082293 RepID=A0A2J6PT70_9HELO|nr:hypothetical protein NA56DRAFT_708111 [Hyaloscypha hepaticicola]
MLAMCRSSRRREWLQRAAKRRFCFVIGATSSLFRLRSKEKLHVLSRLQEDGPTYWAETMALTPINFICSVVALPSADASPSADRCDAPWVPVDHKRCHMPLTRSGNAAWDYISNHSQQALQALQGCALL